MNYIPEISNDLKYMSISFPGDFIKSRYSAVNLKGAVSKLTFPGLKQNIKPKSIWMILPMLSMSMLPLCLSLI